MSKQYKLKIRPIIVPIGPSIAYVPLSKGLYALIEVDDIALVENANWSANSEMCRDGVTVRNYARTNRSGMHKKMQNWILPVKEGLMVDHVNSNGLDNRRHGNLRSASKTENNRNRRIRHDSKTGLKWVFYRKDTGMYRSQLSVNGKKINCGDHATAQAAHDAALARAKELHGEFARLG